MKKSLFLSKMLAMALVFGLLFTGCFSTPEVKRSRLVKNEDIIVYDVVIDSDYHDDKYLQYALNEFVIDRGGKSYNYQKIGTNDFLITMPGDTPVINDMPRVRQFHLVKTIMAGAIPAAGVLLLCVLVAAADGGI